MLKIKEIQHAINSANKDHDSWVFIDGLDSIVLLLVT